ncbi:MAG: O-antigen ligase family protein [Chloroflexota bacterium]|nr:O-antigen ligase family protein [Chloroflexota bacterium]
MFTRRWVAWFVGGSLAILLAISAAIVSSLLLVALLLLSIGLLALLRWPWIGVPLLIASVPAQQFGAVGPLTVTRAALLAASAGLLLWWTVGKRPVIGSRMALPFLALIGWMLVTAHGARDLGLASADLFRWSVALFAFLAALQVLSGAPERRITALILTIAIAGALEAGFGTVLGLLGSGPASFLVQDAFSRAYGTFGRPNTFAGYLEMAVFPVLWLGLYRLRLLNGVMGDYIIARRAGFAASAEPRRKLVSASLVTTVLLGSSTIMLTGIVISFSRGAWIGVSAGILVTLFVAIRRYWHLVVPAIPLVVLASLVGLTLFAPATLTDRVTSIADEARPFDAASITIDGDNFAVVERMAHWQAGWRMFEDHPLTGVGAGNYNAAYPDYYVRSTFRFSQGHAHNFYIHMLAENGIVGLGIYLTLILSFAFVALRVAIVSSDRLAGALALGALGTMTAVYVHNFFENLHVLNLGVQLSAAWALALTAHWRWAATDAGGVEYSRK